MKDLGITKGEYKIRKNGQELFIDTPTMEICRSWSYSPKYLKHFELFCDAGNTAQRCGLLPSELLKQRDDAVDKVETLVGYLSIMALGKTPPELDAVIKEANEWIEITKVEER
jgi:hypothetical protein